MNDLQFGTPKMNFPSAEAEERFVKTHGHGNFTLNARGTTQQAEATVASPPAAPEYSPLATRLLIAGGQTITGELLTSDGDHDLLNFALSEKWSATRVLAELRASSKRIRLLPAPTNPKTKGDVQIDNPQSEQGRIDAIRILVAGARAAAGCDFQADDGRAFEAAAIADGWDVARTIQGLINAGAWFGVKG